MSEEEKVLTSPLIFSSIKQEQPVTVAEPGGSGQVDQVSRRDQFEGTRRCGRASQEQSRSAASTMLFIESGAQLSTPVQHAR